MTPAAGATRRAWSHAEEEALRILSPLGGPACAEAFDRTHGSIRHRAAALHVSLRRRTFGIVLGQCGPAVLSKVKEYSAASLCPSCAMRPQAVKSTGLCGPCHKRNLIEGHSALMAELAAQREYDTSKQRMKRMRDAAWREAAAVSGTDTRDASATMVEEQSTDPGEATCTQ